MKRTLVKGAMVCGDEGIWARDILIEDGRILAVAPQGWMNRVEAEEVDVSGLFALPGMWDLHVHVDETIAGHELADTWSSGSEAAIRWGLTGLASFITQRPGESMLEAVSRGVARSDGQSRCEKAFHLTPIKWNKATDRELDELYERGFRTLKLYSTYKEAGLYSGWRRVETVMRHQGRAGWKVLLHAEDDLTLGRIRKACVSPGEASGHARLRPPVVEVTAVRKAAEIVRRWGGTLHVVHVSCPESVEILEELRNEASITFETCPQYFCLDESWLERPDGSRWVCSPPLRLASARERMADFVRQGRVDLVASDHCAFPTAVKDAPFRDVREIPCGMAGLGSLVPLTFETLGGDPYVAFPRMARMLAEAPAQVLGLYPRKGSLHPGADADIVFACVSDRRIPLRSSAADTPETYPGQDTSLEIRHVLLRGEWAVRDGAVVGEPRGILQAAEGEAL